MTDNLAQRIERMEAVEQIRNLMADYTHYSDLGWEGAGYSPEKLAALFSDDGVWDAGASGGRFVGRAAIRKVFELLDGPTVMSVHIAMNPRIDVDGERAEGRWNGFIPIVKRDNGAQWICGKYHCKFQRTGEGWKIAQLRFVAAFQTPYDEGFGKTRFKNSTPVMKTMPA